MTVVQIANMALSNLGDKTISSLTEQSKQARLCQQFYEVARDKILADYPWTFATAFKTLGALSEAPEFSGYEIQYAVPSDVLQIQGVVGTDDYELIGGNIHTNVSPCTIRYTRKVTNSDLFPAEVAEVISYYLAMKLSIPLAADKQTKAILYQEFISHMEDAKGKDGKKSQGEPEGKLWVDQI